MKIMNYEKLSKEVSYALRHAPHEYQLEMDAQGWVPIAQLLEALKEQPIWQALAEEDLHHMITVSDKKRHEISGVHIRALYGHSIPQKVEKVEKEPPQILYHGTSRKFLPSILEKGLLPKGRQYVHLSEDLDTANQVGNRRDEHPVILQIAAKRAWAEGSLFYHGNERVWLADQVDVKYISVMNG